MRNIRPLSVGLIVLVVACHDTVIIDDWGTAGYARLTGRVTRANGGPAAGVAISAICGPESPTFFGQEIGITDAAGHFAADLDAPGPTPIPASGQLVCRLSASADAPPFATTTVSVTFASAQKDRLTTVVDLVESP